MCRSISSSLPSRMQAWIVVVARMISTTGMICSPLLSLTRRSETVATMMSASRWRMTACASGGKKPTRRPIVETAPWVCSVESTRCPVSAALMQASIVSRSRISPTMMMSGSMRIAVRSAGPKPRVSMPTSRWTTQLLPERKMNSIGSSIVTML